MSLDSVHLRLGDGEVLVMFSVWLFAATVLDRVSCHILEDVN